MVASISMEKRASLNPSRDEAMQALFSKELSLVKTIENALAAHPPEAEELRVDFHRLSASYRSLLGQVMKLTSISDATQLQLKLTKKDLSRALDKVERLNKNLQTLNQEKDEILALAAHDLRSPLSGIRGLADLIATGQTTNEEETRSFGGEITMIADDTLEMIRNLLDIYRLDHQGSTAELQPVAVRELLSEIEDFSRANALRKQIALHISCPEPDQTLLLEKGLFLRVAENIVSNALKYSPPKKSVDVTLRIEPSQVIFIVRDQGPGLSSEDQTKLFKKFARLASRPTGGESSVGLGLAIVHRILEHLGGRIVCESHLGQGATFIVHFPASIVA